MVAALTLAGGVCGGLLATPLLDLQGLRLPLLIAAGALFGCALALLVVASGTRLPAQWPDSPRAHRAGETTESVSVLRAASQQPEPVNTPPALDRNRYAPADPARVVVPVGDATAGGWWTRPRGNAGQPPRPEPIGSPSTPDLTRYLESSRIVQCPRCGDFRVDLLHTADGFAFRCTSDHRWEWRPGALWPATIKVSRRPPTSQRPDPASCGSD